MRKYIIILSILLNQALIFSQPCNLDTLTLASQLEIDNFQTNYPNCTEINGSVWISSSDITNLNGLIGLTYISGDLRIQENNSLTNLSGLDSLHSIGGNLSIWRNEMLTGFYGLNNLCFIYGGLNIISNNSLVSIAELNNLDSIHGLGVHGNSSLINLRGLEKINSVNGNIFDVWISDNSSLTSLAGLENISHIDGWLTIRNNDSLTSLSDLYNLNSVSEGIFIGGTELTDGNQSLISLIGLDNIDNGTLYTIQVKNNPNLSECNVTSICNYLISNSGILEIENNAPGCNSLYEVKDSCEFNNYTINELTTSIQIYPNPANSFINVKTGNNLHSIELGIYNIQGHKIRSKKGKIETVDISNLGQGVYIIELISDKSITQRKLIIKK